MQNDAAQLIMFHNSSRNVSIRQWGKKGYFFLSSDLCEEYEQEYWSININKN